MELGVSSPFDLDLRRGIFKSGNLGFGESHIGSTEIFLQTIQLRCSGDRYDPRFFSQQPGERDLGRRYLLLLCERRDHIHQSLILLAILFAEPRNTVPEIAAVELCLRIDCSRQEAFPQRTERDEADPKLLQRWKHSI